jgi:hypothetical protein
MDGVLYRIVAARTAPAAVVGRNSTAISVMLFLAGVAELNLMSTLVRFLPTSGIFADIPCGMSRLAGPWVVAGRARGS